MPALPGPDRRATVPTVTKLERVRRCTGTVQTGRGRPQRCLIYADTAIDGRVLCRQHVAQGLPPVRDDPPLVRGEETARAGRASTADHVDPGDLLRRVHEHLRAGVADPADDRLVLAVVPAALIGAIEEALDPARREP